MKRLVLLFAVVVAACKGSNPAPQTQSKSDDPSAPSARPAPPGLSGGTAPAPSLNGGPAHTLGSDDGGHERHRGDRMARMDKDGDGKISPEERQAAMKERVDNMRTRLDTNGDGKLTPDELANAKGRMRFDDPKAIDTNNDGEISSDELAAAMQARRDQMREQRLEGRGGRFGRQPQQPQAGAPAAPAEPAPAPADDGN